MQEKHRGANGDLTSVRGSDNGAGIGASHQTGWTGVIARLIQLFGYLDARVLLRGGERTYKTILAETAA